MKRKIALVFVAVAALVTATAGIAVAAGGGGNPGSTDEPALTGATLDKAKAAALDHAGGGTVTDTETGDDGAVYGVEVRKADGSQVEVELDDQFRVVGEEADDDGSGEDDDDAGEADDDSGSSDD